MIIAVHLVIAGVRTPTMMSAVKHVSVSLSLLLM